MYVRDAAGSAMRIDSVNRFLDERNGRGLPRVERGGKRSDGLHMVDIAVIAVHRSRKRASRLIFTPNARFLSAGRVERAGAGPISRGPQRVDLPRRSAERAYEQSRCATKS